MNRQPTYSTIIAMAILGCLIWMVDVFADPMRFDHVLDIGAPGAQTFVQDNDGFIWIGSDGGGIYRYNGYEVKNFSSGPGMLSNGNVWRIVEDVRNPDIFWIGTSGGLNRFDKSTETFTYFFHLPTDPKSLGNNTVQDIVQDPESPDILWIATSGGGLNRFDTTTGTFTRYLPDPKDPDAIAFPDIWRIINDRQEPHILWIGTYGGGLDRFDKRTGKFIHYTHDPNTPNSFSSRGNNVDALIQDRDDPNILWIGTPEDGMDRFDKRTGNFKNYPPELTHGEVALIYDDGKGRLWLGGYVANNGLTIFDKQTETFQNYRNNPNDPDSLSDDLVVNVYEDRSGIYWITTYSGKVDKVDKNKPQFTLFQHDPKSPSSLSHSAVTTVYQDHRGTVWVGTQAGLNRYHWDTGTFTRFVHDPERPDSLDTDYVLDILEDAENHFWIALYVGPLTLFDRDTGTVIRRYQTDAESVSQIVQDPEDPDILWLGTHMKGFARLDKSSGSFTYYEPNPEHPELGPNNTYVQTVYHDHAEPVIWMGGVFGGGLTRFDKRTGKFTHYGADPGNPESLSADAVATIYQDMTGNLWIGTKGGGLNLFDKGRKTFTKYGKKQGVPYEVNTIVEDNNGYLWLGTNNGIVRFDKVKKKADRKYVKADGLQGDTFLFGSGIKDIRGQLWFGGTNGVNRFDPDHLGQNIYSPPVVLTSLTRGGEPVDWDNGKVPWRIREITLDWKENFFEFEFAALNYSIPQKNRYMYKLEGYDKQWYDSGTRRFGRYSNLPGGTYTLRVIGSNNDNVWNEKGVSLVVRVVPPFWETQWFRIVLLITAVGVVFGFFGLRIRSIRKRNEILEFKVRERTRELEAARQKAHAASRAKTVFLANMSHELRSPLNTILGLIRMMLESPELPNQFVRDMKVVYQSSEHLLMLIKQILDVSKIEAGKVALNRMDFDLHLLLEEVADMFRLRMEQKGLHFVIEQEPNLPRYIRTDEVRLKQVLINLLNNALKFTDTGGVTMEVSHSDQDHRLHFTITDTGCGIDPDDLEAVFESFTQTETGRAFDQGAGLGLTITRGFIQLMGGNILVRSKVGSGTSFEFYITYESGHYVQRDRSHYERVAGLAQDQPSYRILVVDEDPENRRIMGMAMERVGFQLRQLSNIQELLPQWQQWRPHLIWMDIRLTADSRDWMDALKTIRNGETASLQTKTDTHTIIIAISASAFEDDRQQLLAAGFDDLLIKPFRESELFEMMATHLGVTYTYEDSCFSFEAEGVGDDDVPDRAALDRIPSHILHEFRRALIGGDVIKIENLVATIQQIHGPVGTYFSKLSADFAYDKLIAFIDAYLQSCEVDS